MHPQPDASTMEAQVDSISNQAIASKAVLPRSCTRCLPPVTRKMVTPVAIAVLPGVAQAQNPAPTKMPKNHVLRVRQRTHRQQTLRQARGRKNRRATTVNRTTSVRTDDNPLRCAAVVAAQFSVFRIVGKSVGTEARSLQTRFATTSANGGSSDGSKLPYIKPLWRANFKASMAAPLAPAVSPLGMT
jgi:hypothetical protein